MGVQNDHGAPRGEAIIVSGLADATPAKPAAMAEPAVYEWLFVGAGITGVYALGNLPLAERDTSLLIDSQDSVGGLWARLPRWQTVQNDPIDFCTEGFTTRKSVWAADDVCNLLRQKVRLQGLGHRIRLGTKLAGYEWSDKEGVWLCELEGTTNGAAYEVRARRIALCTGKHAVPVKPDIPSDGSVLALHSSEVPDFSLVTGRRVAVLGAGASALDLAMHSLEAGAADPVHWVLREPRRFSGIAYNTLWPVVLLQLLWGSWYASFLVSLMVNIAIYGRHLIAGTLSWLPRHPFDMRREQLVPGRGPLLDNRRRITRHVGAGIERIERGTLFLTNGEAIKGVDVLLLGTGYAPPERPRGFRRPANFAGFLPTGPDAGRLFLLGEDLLDTTGATPIVACQLFRAWHEAATSPPPALSAAPPGGDAEAGGAGTGEGAPPARLLNTMDMLLKAAPVLRGVLPFAVWRARMLGVYLYYRLLHGSSVFYADRVLGTGLVLEDLPGAPGALVGGAHAPGEVKIVTE